MSTYTGSSDESNSDHLEPDADYTPPHNVRVSSLEIPNKETRSKTRNLRRRSNSLGTIISLINLKDNTININLKDTLKPEIIMPAAALSFETAINLVPKFNWECAQDVYPFLSKCDFVTKTVSEDCRSVLLQAVLTKLAEKLSQRHNIER